jgi:hypothetical protein
MYRIAGLILLAPCRFPSRLCSVGFLGYPQGGDTSENRRAMGACTRK